MSEMNELDSTCGITDDELTERFKEAIRIENEIKKTFANRVFMYSDKKYENKVFEVNKEN